MGKVAKEAPRNKDTDYLPYEGTNQWWTADPKGEHTLQSAKTGYGSYAKVPLRTIPEVFQQAVKNFGGMPALMTEGLPPIGKKEKPPVALPLKEWRTVSWESYYNDCRNFAKACIAVGMEHYDSVNVFGFNSPEWAISMFGAIFAGGKIAGIYPSDTAESVRYKSDHSNGAIAVCEADSHFEKFKEVVEDLPWLKAIVTWSCEAGDDITTNDGRVIKTFNFDEFMKLGASQEDGELDGRLKKIKAGESCALVYTSGTTGKPKAVMLCHDMINYCAETVLSRVFPPSSKKSQERIISYLPLSHVAGMMLDLICPLVITSTSNYSGSYMTVYYARSYDLKRGTLVDRLKAVKPTLFLGVPRVYEKIMEKLRAVGASTKGLKKRVAEFAKARGARFTKARQLGGDGKTPKSMGFANLLLGQIKAKLGLNKCKFMLSGAAPVSIEVLEYFGALGININEAYGMSETSAVVTFGNNDIHVWGSVGCELPGTEVRIFQKNGQEAPPSKNLFKASEAEQGELCFRGRQIMMGYMANERLGQEHVDLINEKNAEAIDENGWLHSGDKGTRDIRGMIKITGRYKEIIIGAGGENIAPVPIEDNVKSLCPFISNVMMVGNKRKFNVMLITLKTVGATGELPGTNKLDNIVKDICSSNTLTEALDDKAIEEAIVKAITATNNNIDVCPSNAAKVQKFSILPIDFSVLTGELTATLKLKRSVVEAQYDPIISKMYEVEDIYVKYATAPTEGLDLSALDETPVLEKSLSKNFVANAEEAAALEEIGEKE